jgi:hypothetical protein
MKTGASQPGLLIDTPLEWGVRMQMLGLSRFNGFEPPGVATLAAAGRETVETVGARPPRSTPH